MKIMMKGSELKKVDIEFLSLVKRGANRAPFKVIKAEDAATASLEVKTGLVGAVTKFFQMSDPAPAVVAIFIEKSALAKAAPNLADAGFDLSSHEIQDDVVVFKQAGFDDAREVIMVKSEATVGFAVANVGAYADTFCGSLSFDASVAATGFYPGPNEAMRAMQLAVNVEKADSTSTLEAFSAYTKSITKALPGSIAKFEAAQRGFGSATTEITEIAKAASALAETILKDAHPGRAGVKENAKAQLGSSSSAENGNAAGSTTSELPGTSDDSPDDEASKKAKMAKASASTTTTEDDKMSKAQAASSTTSSTEAGESTSTSEEYNFNKSAKPVVLKDADGTEFHLAVSKTGEVIKYTAGSKIPEGHTTMTMPWDQDGALGGTNNGNGQGQGKAADPDTKADNELKYTGAGGLKKLEETIEALAKLPGLVESLAKSIEAQGEVVKTVTTRLEQVEKTAQGAVKKAEDKSVVVHFPPNYDSAYENLGGRKPIAKSVRTPEMVRKAQFPESVWEGSMGALESHIPGVENV